MSQDQPDALLGKLEEDSGPQEKPKEASGLDSALPLAQEGGFDVTKAEWIRCQAEQRLELSDEALMEVTGGLANASVVHPAAAVANPFFEGRDVSATGGAAPMAS